MIDAIRKLVDDLPLATYGAIAYSAGCVVALATGELSFTQFSQALGVGTAGIGVVGVARSIGGKGVRTPKAHDAVNSTVIVQGAPRPEPGNGGVENDGGEYGRDPGDERATREELLVRIRRLTGRE